MICLFLGGCPSVVSSGWPVWHLIASWRHGVWRMRLQCKVWMSYEVYLVESYLYKGGGG